MRKRKKMTLKDDLDIQEMEKEDREMILASFKEQSVIERNRLNDTSKEYIPSKEYFLCSSDVSSPHYSSTIRSVHYDTRLKVMYIEFRNRRDPDSETDTRTYIYKSIPIELWDRFKTATSFGKFFHTHIKPKYVGERIA